MKFGGNIQRFHQQRCKKKYNHKKQRSLQSLCILVHIICNYMEIITYHWLSLFTGCVVLLDDFGLTWALLKRNMDMKAMFSFCYFQCIWTIIWFYRKWRYCQSMIWILLCKILWTRMIKWHFTLVYNTIFKKHEWVFCAAFIFHMPLFMMLLCCSIWSMVYSTSGSWRYCQFFLFSLMTFILNQNKIAKDSDNQKFEEEDLIIKVGECLEVRSFIIVVYY